MTFDAPILLAFFVVALLGYFAGRAQRSPIFSSSPQVKRALQRARAIASELNDIRHRIHDSLQTHRSHLNTFDRRLKEITRTHSGPSWDDLSVEAENLLKPTLGLATQIAHAYDSIRQQTHLLMALTEVRTDPLTGLRNRRSLDEALQSRLAMLDRYSNEFSITVFDVDHFKAINDESGHIEGDRVLQEIARVLEASVRDTDLAVRFGGEEFVIVMPETNLAGAKIFAERTRGRIEQELNVTVSGGVTEASMGDEPRGLLARADEAMYAAKRNGRNQVFYCVAGDDTPVQIAKEALPLPDALFAESSETPESSVGAGQGLPLQVAATETTTTPTTPSNC